MAERSKTDAPGAAKPAVADEEDPNVTGGYASPPCFMHELASWEDPALEHGGRPPADPPPRPAKSSGQDE